jgi:hypothetical protein
LSNPSEAIWPRLAALITRRHRPTARSCLKYPHRAPPVVHEAPTPTRDMLHDALWALAEHAQEEEPP